MARPRSLVEIRGMSSSLALWQGQAQDAFAEVERAHGKVEGEGRGRRFLTQQVNHAYVTLLAAQFQMYCRALHTEVTQVLVAGVSDPALARVLEGRLIEGRNLDRGNANVPNLGADFGRFGFRFWDAVIVHRKPNARRKEKLDALIEWRNAIAHGDIARKQQEETLAPREVHLASCRDWKSALNQLVLSIDQVLAIQCENLGRPRPW